MSFGHPKLVRGSRTDHHGWFPDEPERKAVEILYKTEVTPDQIDHLGHMNVRYYGAHARTGAAGLLASLGLTDDEVGTLVQRDTYVRHHREQLVGAPLEVRGAILDAAPGRIRLYEELVNADTNIIAATFVLAFEKGFDDVIVAAAAAAVVELPDHGRPELSALTRT